METDNLKDGAPKILSLTITPEILKGISELDEFKGAWSAIGRLAPDRLANLRQVATIESVGSSTRIEGVKLSDRDVETLLLDLEVKEFKHRDDQEVAGYAYVMDMVFGSWSDIDLSENHIKQLHRDLLRYTTKDEGHRGHYKTVDSHVEAFGPDGESLGVIFETATPFDTPAKMAALVAWTSQALDEKEHHPLIVISIFIVTFLAIHPFQDGNGRLSRILTTLLLLKSGYAYVPYASLESVIEQSKEGYYLALRQTQGTIQTDAPNWQPWVTFFLKALLTQKERLEVKIKREKIILGDLPVLSVEILDIVRQHGRVTVADVLKVTGKSRPTIKDHFKSLKRTGYLEQHGKGRGVWYSLGSSVLSE
jgi:Fic family protein